MKKLFFAAAILSGLFLTSCKSGGGDPKAVLTSFFEALGKKDIEGARKFATTESKSMLDMLEMGMKMDKDGKESNKYDKDKMEFGEAKIDGDKATIPVKEKTTGETTNFTLKKENGAWKVAFDKASMMEMGMEKMKEKGAGGMDSLGNMDHMNMDSAMQSLDSVKEMMKDMKTN